MKLFSLIFHGNIHLAARKKILPKNEVSALLDAKEVLAKAEEDAKQFTEETHKACEKLRKEAEEEGFQEGLSKFNEHIVLFEQQLKKIHHDTLQAILPLALKAAKRVVGKELELHPDTIVDIVLQALAPTTQSHKIKIYVHKEEKERLEKERPRIKEIFEHLQTLSILEREDISPGGCIIETESGIINATIENQWRALEAAFEKYIPRS